MSTPKRSYAESDADEASDVEEEYVPMAKRVKAEPLDEEDGLGFDAFGAGVDEEV